jgi:3-hydroxyisobutyrate dehydrogenase-like beta-hydroxyacid dehydrogenase
MSKIGFIGLGTMGGSFARNVQKAGYEMVVNDLHRQYAEPHIAAGATWADSPRRVAESCAVVLTSLPGPPEVAAVAAELANGFAPGSVVFDLSTNSPTVVRQLHADYAKRGLHFLDAPVSGGPKGAASGRCAIWVGGEREVFEKHRAVLDAMGDQVRYIGPIGAGSVAKLVHNSAGYAIQCALAEVFSLGVKAGVPPLALFEAVRQGARGRVRTFDSLADQFLVNSYEPPSFALRLAHKDMSLAAQLGHEVGVPLRMINLALQELTEARARGWDQRDSRSAMLLQLERAGIEIKEKPEAVRAVLDADKGK